MRHLLSFPALLLILNGFSTMAPGQTGATTTLTASPATITVGSSVGLAATVQPNSAPGAGKTVPRPSGTITFLDGGASLNSAPIALAPNGIASATFPQTFGTPDPSLTAGRGEVVGDLNGDGVQDLLIYSLQPRILFADFHQQRERRLQRQRSADVQLYLPRWSTIRSSSM